MEAAARAGRACVLVAGRCALVASDHEATIRRRGRSGARRRPRHHDRLSLSVDPPHRSRASGRRACVLLLLLVRLAARSPTLVSSPMSALSVPASPFSLDGRVAVITRYGGRGGRLTANKQWGGKQQSKQGGSHEDVRWEFRPSSATSARARGGRYGLRQLERSSHLAHQLGRIGRGHHGAHMLRADEREVLKLR